MIITKNLEKKPQKEKKNEKMYFNIIIIKLQAYLE